MSLNIFSSGVNTSFSTELNENFAGLTPSTTYTGSDFDNGGNHTLQIAGDEIDTGVWIEVTFKASASATLSGGTPASSASVSFKIEVDETSQGSLTTIFNQTIVNATSANAQTTRDTNSFCGTVRFYYEPTAGEKSNGLDIKFTSTTSATAGGGSASATLVNIQTNLLVN